jgi:hypothetical protein
MKTREEIMERAQSVNGTMPGIPNVTRMLALVLEVMLDIRDGVQAIEANQPQN